MIRPLLIAAVLTPAATAAQVRGSAPAAAPAHEDPARAAVAAALSGYETIPPAWWWRARGSATVLSLASLYNDPTTPTYVRLRAVRAAGHYPGDASLTFLCAVAYAPRQHDLFVRAAVFALGSILGEGAVEHLTRLESHPSPVVRGAVIRVAQTLRGTEATRLLSRRAAAESSPHLRNLLSGANEVDEP